MSDYFLQLQNALKKANIAKPTLVIDRDRLKQNINVMAAALPAGMGYRIVAKSLPCQKLIEEVRAQTKTDKLMVFNIDYLEWLIDTMPECDMLLGKPMPAAAVEQFLQKQSPPNKNIQWLVDGVARLHQYDALAERLGTPLRINLELDVGLHRGGLETEKDIAAVLDKIKASAYLTLSGFMGYEPHLASLPEQNGWRERAKQGAWDFYQKALQLAEKRGFDLKALTRNAAGSPTYRLWTDSLIANEVSVGSVLLKPTNFDSELLEEHIAASFIASPVLKRMKGIKVPGMEYANKPSPYQPPENHDGVFIYGGKWSAELVYPQGAKVNEVYGKSSNQEMLEVPEEVALAVDDFVFYRPTQSEAILTYLGDIAIYEAGAITEFWQPFAAKP